MELKDSKSLSNLPNINCPEHGMEVRFIKNEDGNISIVSDDGEEFCCPMLFETASSIAKDAHNKYAEEVINNALSEGN